MANIAIVCSNIIEEDGKYLLVKEAKEVSKDLYAFPGGQIELGESLTECAVREAKEETGLDVALGGLVGVYQRPLSGRGFNVAIFAFKSRVVGGSITTSEMHPEVRHFSYEEFKELEQNRLLVSPYVSAAMEDYRNGRLFDLSVIREIR